MDIEVERTVPDMIFSAIVKGQPVDFSKSPDNKVKSFAAGAGFFHLYPAKGKLNTGWALGGAHGSHNFVHLVDHDTAPIADTFLLLNSSPALIPSPMDGHPCAHDRMPMDMMSHG
ncbi:hypothetical protein ACFQ4K_20830 [Tistrella bauzanensis]